MGIFNDNILNHFLHYLIVKVKVYTGSHQRALRRGSQLVLTLARAPLKNKKEKQQRLMRIRRIVSHAIRPAPSTPAVSCSTSAPPSRSPVITFVVDKVYLCLLFMILFKLYIAWQCRFFVASWCTLCVGTPKFSRGVVVYGL